MWDSLTVPVHVYHSAHDILCDVEGSRELCKTSFRHRIFEIEDGVHGLLNDIDVVCFFIVVYL